MTATIRVGGRPLVALMAVVYLGLMFISGAPPTYENRIEAVADGVLTVDPESIIKVELEHRGTTKRFQRDGDRWVTGATGISLNKLRETLLTRAITFMHTATPVRVLSPEAVVGVAPEAYGLDQPTFMVRLSTIEGPVLTAHFGDRANDGILQYLKVEGRGEIYLMSGFVGEAWLLLPDPEAPINARINHGEHSRTRR